MVQKKKLVKKKSPPRKKKDIVQDVPKDSVPYILPRDKTDYKVPSYEEKTESFLKRYGMKFVVGTFLFTSLIGFYFSYKYFKGQPSSKVSSSGLDSVVEQMDTTGLDSVSEDDEESLVEKVEPTKNAVIGKRLNVGAKEAKGIVLSGEQIYSIKIGGLGSLMKLLSVYGNDYRLDKGDTVVLDGKSFCSNINIARGISGNKSFDAKYESLDEILVWKNPVNKGKRNLCNFLISIKPGLYDVPETFGCKIRVKGDVSGYAKFDFSNSSREFAALFFYIGKVGKRDFKNIVFEPSTRVSTITPVQRSYIRIAEVYRSESGVIGRLWNFPGEVERGEIRKPLILEHNLTDCGLTSIGYKADWKSSKGYYAYEKVKKMNPNYRPQVVYPGKNPFKLLSKFL